MVRRVRVRTPGQRAAATHSADRLFCHLYVALRGVSFRHRSGCPHFPYDLCTDRRPDSAEAARLQLQRGGLGRLHLSSALPLKPASSWLSIYMKPWITGSSPAFL